MTIAVTYLGERQQTNVINNLIRILPLIEIITIGDELLCGRTQDTNASMIARELHAAGFTVTRITTTGDTHDAISAALLACLKKPAL